MFTNVVFDVALLNLRKRRRLVVMLKPFVILSSGNIHLNTDYVCCL